MITTESNFVYPTNRRIKEALKGIKGEAPLNLDTFEEVAAAIQALATSVLELGGLSTAVEDNELTIAAALNDLNNRVSALED